MELGDEWYSNLSLFKGRILEEAAAFQIICISKSGCPSVGPPRIFVWERRGPTVR
jgi:hypothetical protein